MSHLTLTSFETAAIFAVLVVAVISLVYAFLLYRNVMAESKGTERMIRYGRQLKRARMPTWASSCARSCRSWAS